MKLKGLELYLIYFYPFTFLFVCFILSSNGKYIKRHSTEHHTQKDKTQQEMRIERGKKIVQL